MGATAYQPAVSRATPAAARSADSVIFLLTASPQLRVASDVRGAVALVLTGGIAGLGDVCLGEHAQRRLLIAVGNDRSAGEHAACLVDRGVGKPLNVLACVHGHDVT